MNQKEEIQKWLIREAFRPATDAIVKAMLQNPFIKSVRQAQELPSNKSETGDKE